MYLNIKILVNPCVIQYFFPCKSLLTSDIFTNRISKHNLYERYVLFLFYRNVVKYKLDFIHKAPSLKHDEFWVLFYKLIYYIDLYKWYRYIQYVPERTKSSWTKYCLQVGAIAIWYRQGTGITGLFSCRLGYMLCLSLKYCMFYTEYKLSIDGIK